MSKKNIVKEDSEFRYLEEHFEEMMEEMKKDKLTQDFQISHGIRNFGRPLMKPWKSYGKRAGGAK